MTIKTELLNILYRAIELNAPNIQFNLVDNGEIWVLLRAGNIMVQHSSLSTEKYKQMLKYVEKHTTFETRLKEYPYCSSGVIKFFEPKIIIVCNVSIMVNTFSGFKSLNLRIKNPFIPKCKKEIKKQAEMQI